MKSRTSLFNRTVIVNLLQRYWVGFAAYLIILGAVTVLPLINALQATSWNATNVPYYASLIQLMGNLQPVLVVNFITVAVAATLLFSYLYNSRHTGMMASLPIKRETMYLSVSAAAVGGLTLCNLVIALVLLLVEVLYGQLHLGAIGMLTGVSVLSIVCFFGMAAFCCMLTGNIFAGPAVYFIFNFLTIGVESLVNTLLRKVVFGMPAGFSPVTQFLSPILQVAGRVVFDYERINNEAGKWVDYTWQLEGVGVLAIYTLIGLVFLWLGMLLYKNRRMETAGDTISIEILKPVFRFCCTVGAGLIFAVFMQELLYQITPRTWMAAAYIAVLLIIGGALGYFIAKMLIEKTVRVFRTGWKTVGIYAVCCIVIMAAIEGDLFGYEKKVPAVSEIKSVGIHTFDGNYMDFDEAENIETVVKLHQAIIANKAFHEMENGTMDVIRYIGQFEEPTANFSRRMLLISYDLGNDKFMERRYMVAYGPDEIRDTSSEIRTLEALINTEEGIAERYIVDYPVTINSVQGGWVEYVDKESYERFHFNDLAPSEIVRLYTECILPDIQDGTLGVIHIIENEEYAKNKYNCTIGLDLAENVTENPYLGGYTYTDYRSIQVYPTLDAHRTIAFLKEYGIEPATVYDSMTAEGYVFDDLGSYRPGDEDIDFYEKTLQEMGIAPMAETREVTTYVAKDAPASVGVIGGADGPTQVYVTK